MPTDGTLYNCFLGGDTKAYDQLMIRYGDSLTLYLYGYLHDWQEAEDLMIEAFARIMVKKPRISEGSFKAYLFKTGRNLALRFQKRKRSLEIFSTDGMDPGLAENILAAGARDQLQQTDGGDARISGSSVEEELWQKERREALYLCLDKIEPELREAIWLIYFEGMTYVQAAEIMEVKTKRIDRLLARGKQQLKKELEKKGITNAYE